MKKSILAAMIMSASALILTGCGGGGNDSNNNSNQNNTPETPTTSDQVKVNSIQILDANNQPIQNAEIKILSSSEWGKATINNSNILPDSENLPTLNDFNSAVLVTDDNGQIKVNSLTPEQYYVLVKKDENNSISSFIIKKENSDESITLNVPLSCDQQQCSNVNGIIGSLAGQVVSNGKPVVNAQVSLNGGSATNGAFVTALTDEKGNFSLSFNVSSDLAEALKNAKIVITASGYETIQQVVPVYGSASFGTQFTLIPVSITSDNEIVWRETFEPDSATVNQWVKDQSLEQPKWNLIQSNHSIRNNLVDVAVRLSPNDLSEGYVPTPPQGNNAYWYGDVVSGNFIGVLNSAKNDFEGAIELNGGTSESLNSGALTSPVINLSNIQKPISLSFKTWWEIESVNPNDNGFDLMDIQVSVDGGETYKTIARLNPLSDPETTINRAAIPFTNFGYNRAPSTSQQEAISLDEYAGQENVRIKFEFKTVDQLYNGFRGWMIDDIVIQKTQGTFPAFVEKPWDAELPQVDEEVPVLKMLKTISKKIDVKARWADLPQRKI
jgi:hypothetical protein